MMFFKNFVAAIKVDGKILREQGDTVKLPFGCEYSILLKNLSNVNIRTNIDIDGVDVLDGYSLIVPPNAQKEIERTIVDHNLYSGPKFKFIEKTEKISDYRGNKLEDGIVRITYQFEDVNVCNYGSSRIITTNQIHETGFYKSCNMNMNTNMNTRTATYSTNNTQNNNVNESGITINGSDSNQKFEMNTQNIVWETHKNTMCFLLKGYNASGESITAPVTTKSKIKCDVCGTKNMSYSNFCFECGNNLKW